MQKNMAFYVPTGCVRYARYYGKMYSRHLFPHGGLETTRNLLLVAVLDTRDVNSVAAKGP